MRWILLIPVLLLMMVSGCDLFDDATSEDVEKSVSHEVLIVTNGAEVGEAEKDFNVCELTDLCSRWDNVESVVVTALAYKLTYFQSTNETHPVSINGSMLYKLDNSWVHLTDVVMDDMSAFVGDRIEVPISEAVGSDLGSMLLNNQSFSVKITGETSDAIWSTVEIYATLKATISL